MTAAYTWVSLLVTFAVLVGFSASILLWLRERHATAFMLLFTTSGVSSHFDHAGYVVGLGVTALAMLAFLLWLDWR